ncbi:MAG: sugar ABC transporter permease [Chroococcus sp. CMT-3BRIN-NPC107]|jgi:multiple sugar transport system permease protein|nr:sugar ABC transporter permease [Chroococcus sp. CMT-3BRIN-NPC107]
MVSKSNKQFNDSVNAYFFISPTIIILLIFLVLPIVLAILLSLYKVQPLGDISYAFRGGKNFLRLTQDERVAIALKNTVEYVAIVVPIQTVLALSLALILNAQIKGKNIFRVLFFLPTVTSSAVLTLIFMWICNSNGLLNSFLAFIHLPTYNWLVHEGRNKPSV